MDERQLTLLGRSIALSLSGAALALLIGLCAAFFLWRARRRALYTALLFFALPLSSTAYTTALRNFCNLFALKISPEVSVVIVYAAMMMPLCALALFSGFSRVADAEISAARVLRSDTACFFRVVLAQNVPMVLAVFLFAAMLNLLDYTVPSLFSISVYTLDIFALFSATADAGAAMLRSVPIFAVSVLLLALMFLQMKSIWSVNPQGNDGRSLHTPGPVLSALNGLGFAVCMLPPVTILSSLVPLFTETGTFLTAIATSFTEMGYSVWLCLTAAVAGTALALAVSRLRGGFLLAALVFAATPPALVGICLLYLLSPLGFLDKAMPVIALVLRFFPFAAVILYIARMTESREERNAALVFARGRTDYLLRYKLPAMTPALLISATVIFAFSLGELGATLLVIPPGATTLTIKLYNYLHYGSGPAVSGISCMIGAVTLAAAAVAWRFRTFFFGKREGA